MSKNGIETIKFELKKCDNNSEILERTKIKLYDIGVFSEVIKTGIESVSSIINKGSSGLYYVNAYGGKLCFSDLKDANIGATILDNGDMAQAALKQVVFNPLTFCSSISNITLQLKLNEISKKIDKVLKCFEENDRAKLKGGFKKLIDIMNKYEERKSNESLINSDISRVYKYSDDADDIKIKYTDKINDIICTPSKWNNKKAYNDIRKYYNMVVQSMALQGLAVYMITILEGKFNKKYLELVKNNLEKEFEDILQTYDKCTDFIATHIANDWYEKAGLVVDKICEKLLIHVPLWPVKLVAGGVALVHTNIKNKDQDKYLSYFDEKGKPMKIEYIDKIDKINELYNEPIKLLVDTEYLYL